MKKEIEDIKEKLDTLMNRLPLEEKKLKKEGKVYFFSGGGEDNWTAVVAPLRIFFESWEIKQSKRYLSVSAND